MKKTILLFLIALLASCGINTETTVEYDLDSDKVVLTSTIEVDETYYEYIVGGRKSVTNALKDNLWEGAKLTEEVDGYKIVTNFKTLDLYNEFMKKQSGSEGIVEDISIDVLAVNTQYTFSDDEASYLDGYIDDVYESLEFTEEIEFDIETSDHTVSRYINGLFIKDGTHKNTERYKTESNSMNLNLGLKVEDDEVEVDFESLDIQFEIYVESEHDRTAIIENFKDLGFEVKEDENKLLVSATYKDKKKFPEGVYLTYPEVECTLDDSSFFTNKYSCDIDSEYTDGLTGNLNIDGGRVASSIPVEIFVNGKNISKDLGEEITELKVGNLILLAGIILFVVGIFVVIYKILKKIYKDKGIVKGLGESKVVKGMQNVTKDSFGTIKEEISSSGFSADGTEVDAPKEKKRVLEWINDFVEIKLVTILLILFSTPYALIGGYNQVIGGASGDALKGQIFIHGADKNLGDLSNLLSFGFGTFLRVLMIILTFAMLVKYILVVARIFKLSPLLNKLLDTIYYTLLLITFLVFAFYALANRNDGISLNYVYYPLILISIYSIIKTLVGFGKNFKMSMFSKFFILTILMNFINIYGLTFSYEQLEGVTYGLSFSNYVFTYNVPFLFGVLIICTIVVIVFLILDLAKVFNAVTSSIIVYINMVLYPSLLLIYYFAFVSVVRTEDFGGLIVKSFVLKMPGVIYLIICILMVVYSIIETIHISKVAKQKKIEEYNNRVKEQQIHF